DREGGRAGRLAGPGGRRCGFSNRVREERHAGRAAPPAVPPGAPPWENSGEQRLLEVAVDGEEVVQRLGRRLVAEEGEDGLEPLLPWERAEPDEVAGEGLGDGGEVLRHPCGLGLRGDGALEEGAAEGLVVAGGEGV